MRGTPRSSCSVSSGVRRRRASAAARRSRSRSVRSASATVRWARCSTSSIDDAALADLGERLEDDVDDRRREPERRLVEQQARRARRRARAPIASCCCWPPESAPAWRRAELGDDREELVRPRESASAPSRRAGSREPEPEVLLDRQLAEDAPALGHERDRRARDRSPACGRGSTCPPSADVAARARHEPMIACSVVDLPAPFGPIRPTISPAADLERRAPRTAGDRAVADIQVLELEHRAQRRASSRPPRSRRGRPTVTSRFAADLRRAFPRRASGPGRARGSGRRRP